MTTSRQQELQKELQRRKELQSELSKRKSEGQFDPFRISNLMTKQMNNPITPGQIGRNFLSGVDTSGQNIAEMFTGQKAPSGLQEMLNIKPKEELPEMKALGQYAPLSTLGVGGGLLPWLGRSVAAGAYGASQSPEDRVKGGLVTGGLQAGFGAPKLGIELAKKFFPRTSEAVVNYVKDLPEQISKSITEYLGKGSKNLEEVSDKMSGHVYKGAQAQKDLAIEHYWNPLENKHGKEVIYDMVKGKPNVERIPSKLVDKEGKPLSYETKITPGKSSYDIPKLDLPKGNSKLEMLDKQFRQKPTLKRAQDYQSDLRKEGHDILNNPNSSNADRAQAIVMLKFADRILDRMGGFLKTKGKLAYDAYQAFRKVYNKEYKYPYTMPKKISDMAKGEKSLVESPHLPFKYPSNVRTKEGAEKIGKINTVMEHMPEEFGDLIMFSKVGGHQPADSLAKALQNATAKGYSKYVSKTLEQQMKDLNSSLEAREALKDILKREEKIRKRSRNIGIGMGSLIGIPTVGTGLYKYLTSKPTP